MDEDKVIQERKEKILKVFTKNNYVKVFSIIAAAVILISLVIYADPSTPFLNFLSFTEWISLAGAFVIAAILAYYEKTSLMFIPLFIWLIFLGVEIRTLPMSDHNGHPGLWDITTNTWTLGPDLDPWLFERYAKTIVETGHIPTIDMMRNVPLGSDTSSELQMVSFMVVLTYKLLNIFGSYNIELAAVLNPVMMFALTIISFFLLVREIFVRDSKESKIKANTIALLSTFFMIISPAFLSRTIAGIPEKEANGFFFMFLAFYLFLKAWKSDKPRSYIFFSVLAGVATALMGLTWGGVVYVYISIAAATLFAFLLNKVNKKEYLIYLIWNVISFVLVLFFTNRFSVKGYLTSLDSGLAFLVLIICSIHILLTNTKLSKIKLLNNDTIPKNIISLVISLGLILAFVLIVLGPSFIVEKALVIHQTIFHPVTGRWSTTVAENRQPDFQEWSQSFGPFIQTIPLLFWLFFIGSVVLFKKMIQKINKKESWILTGLYVFFLLGMIFSRYSSTSIFNGENFISQLFYYASVVGLLGGLTYYYFYYHKKKDRSFETIEFEYIFIFILFALTLFTARGAVRLIMVLAPIAPIFVAYLTVEGFSWIKKSKDETMRIIVIALLVLIIGATLIVAQSFTQEIKSEAYNFVPTVYNQQWQKAMQWVRDETPQNAVFAHWWDYGYWLQSIGNRATVLDGGNSITYWNYFMGRLVLTGDNQQDSLNFLYSHNATYLLIDSSDIGKYGAFASIGSNQDYDRYSWIGTFIMDEKQTQETSNQTLLVYPGGIATDEDQKINDSGKEIILPGQKTGVGAIILPTQKVVNGTNFAQPSVVYFYNGKQYRENLRYLDINGKFIDFKNGIEGCAFIFPEIIPNGQRVSENPIGAAMYLSPRLMRGYFAQKYILDDPFKKFPNFKVAHKEPNLIIDSLNSQGMNLPDFVYYQGVQGPITIWNITYTGKEKVMQDYLETDARKHLSWEL